MNYKRLIVAAVAIFIFALFWNSLVHGVILREANAALTGIARPVAERNLGLSLCLTAGLALLFVWSYAVTARSGSLRAGIRQGLFFAILAGLLVDLNQYLLYPIPASLALQWFGFGLVEFCVYGLLASWLYPIRMRPSVQTDQSL